MTDADIPADTMLTCHDLLGWPVPLLPVLECEVEAAYGWEDGEKPGNAMGEPLAAAYRKALWLTWLERRDQVTR